MGGSWQNCGSNRGSTSGPPFTTAAARSNSTPHRPLGQSLSVVQNRPGTFTQERRHTPFPPQSPFRVQRAPIVVPPEHVP